MADVFTNAGAALIADILDGSVSVPSSWYIGWGTGAGTSNVADTTLFTESPEGRVIASNSQPASDTNRFVATLTASAARTITNAGVFDAASSGNLLVKGDFADIGLSTGDKIEFTVDLQHQ